MKIAVILENSGGEVDRKEISVAEPPDDDTIDVEIGSAIESWLLSVGDTIRIVEVPVTDKTCTGCKESLPAKPEYFWRDRHEPDGLRKRCKACCSETPCMRRRSAAARLEQIRQDNEATGGAATYTQRNG